MPYPRRIAPDHERLSKPSKNGGLLTLAECSPQLIGQGLEHVRQHGATTRLNEHFNRHARDDLETTKTSDFYIRDGNANCEVGNSGALILGLVRCDPANLPIQLRRRPQIEGGEAQQSRLARA